MRVVIVGGVAGGATAAARLRRLSEKAHVTVFERGADVSFANCGLPYYLGETIKDRSKLVVHSATSLSSLLSVEVKTHHEVVAIDRAKRTVRVRPTGSAVNEVLEVPYDKLLLSMGAAPVRPPRLPGSTGVPNVFTLRTLGDVDAMKARVDTVLSRGRGGHTIILGAGFIGLEVAEQLKERAGMSVTVIEARDHVLPVLDREMTITLLNDIRSQGVQVLLSETATEIAAAGSGSDGVVVKLGSGASIHADLLLLCVGVAPETTLAKEAGLELEPRSHAILVNEHLQSSDPAIYAVGDAVAAPDFLLPGQHSWLSLGGPANRQARLAADHMVLGDKADKYRGNLGTAILRCFNTVVGCTGMTEGRLKSMGRAAATVTVTGNSHASYYPGSQPITIKACYDATTRKLLGAQVYGGSEGVDKRLDVLATTIATGGTVDDLAHLELSYSPPFGSARDVINTVGFAAQNVAAGFIVPADAEFTAAAAAAVSGGAAAAAAAPLPNADKVVVVDVRDSLSAEVRPAASMLPPGTQVINIPHDMLREEMQHGTSSKALADPTKQYVTVCNLGKLSYFAARTMAQHGLHVSTLVGGLQQLTLAQPNQPMAALPPSLPPAPLLAPPKALDIDAVGLACPGPILALRKALPQLSPGSTLRVTASDPGFQSDVRAFAASAGLDVTSVVREKGIITAQLKVPGGAAATASATGAAASGAAAVPAAPGAVAAPAGNPHDVAIILFSGEMDKVLAALVIANGAVAMGGQAVIFSTFWGITAFRTDHTLPEIEAKRGAADSSLPPTKHGFIDKMMAAMLPSGPSHLPLSHMNYGGAGATMMKHVMTSKHLPSIPGLMREALASGKVRFVACTMSMTALGIDASSLLPGVEFGGVADFLGSAAKAHTTLFI